MKGILLKALTHCSLKQSKASHLRPWKQKSTNVCVLNHWTMQYFILIPISSGASFCTIFHQFFKSQPFDAIEDHPHPYISTPTVYPSSSTRPNKLEFTAESGLLNEELNPFGKDEDKVLHNQPQEEDKEEEARPVSPIKIVPPCYIPSKMNILKNPIFKSLNKGIAWITKKSNIWWGLSLKGCICWQNKKYEMLCSSIMWANELTIRHNYRTQQN